jgi:hypothetical protein
LLFVLTLAGLIFGSVRFAAGVAAGGILSILNFYWLRTTLQRVLLHQPGHSDRYVQVRYLLRLTLLGAALYGLIVVGTNVFGLLLGLSVLVINIIALAFYYTMTPKGG